jgi:hypothetical protein
MSELTEVERDAKEALGDDAIERIKEYSAVRMPYYGSFIIRRG